MLGKFQRKKSGMLRPGDFSSTPTTGFDGWLGFY